MKILCSVIVATLLLSIPPSVYSAEDHYARELVIQALDLQNNLGVSGREFKTKPNPKGKGIFVYDPRTNFNGAKRNLIWIVIDDEAYPLVGASKNLTPSLKWTRKADSKV